MSIGNAVRRGRIRARLQPARSRKRRVELERLRARCARAAEPRRWLTSPRRRLGSGLSRAPETPESGLASAPRLWLTSRRLRPSGGSFMRFLGYVCVFTVLGGALVSCSDDDDMETPGPGDATGGAADAGAPA